jgi:hypothetical protein
MGSLYKHLRNNEQDKDIAVILLEEGISYQFIKLPDVYPSLQVYFYVSRFCLKLYF